VFSLRLLRLLLRLRLEIPAGDRGTDYTLIFVNNLIYFFKRAVEILKNVSKKKQKPKTLLFP
jgi:hypothetical protein